MADDLDILKKHPAVLRLYQARVHFRKDGKEYVASCPDHSDSSPSLHLYYHEDGTLLFKCFGKCQKHGNIFQFIEWRDKVTQKQAIELVREAVGGSWDEKKAAVDAVFKPVQAEPKVFKTYSLAEYAAFEKALDKSDAGKAWLAARGIPLETAQRLHVGFRQDVGKLAGQENAAIAAKGWIAFARVEGGKVVGIHYRSIVRKACLRQPGMATTLYNVETIDPFEPVLVTEGECDTLVLEAAGLRAVSIASASVALTPAMRDQLLQAESVILAGDNDEAGRKALGEKLQAELERSYLVEWPEGCKDANDVLLKHCKGDLSAFRTTLQEIVTAAKSKPMPGVYSLAESMGQTTRTNLADHPDRMRFPWPTVDRMAILLPGSVTTLSATNSKMGKSVYCINFTLHGARKHNEVVLNYQAELSVDEFNNIVASHVLKKDRNHLTPDDYKEAARRLKGVQYYIGRDPTLTTVGPVLDLIEAAIRRVGATVVVIDHIHFLCLNQQNEIQVQADAMQRIKNMAGTYKCKFVVVSQPRKADSKNKGKDLHITDFKGSEAITSSADAIFAIHRNFVKDRDPNNPPTDDYEPETTVTLIGARAKGDGPTQARLLYHGALATFHELTVEPSPGQGNIS